MIKQAKVKRKVLENWDKLKTTWQFLGPKDHLGLDHRAVSKLRVEPKIKFAQMKSMKAS